MNNEITYGIQGKPTENREIIYIVTILLIRSYLTGYVWYIDITLPE